MSLAGNTEMQSFFESRVNMRDRAVIRQRSLLAALPVAVCLVLPLMQLRGTVYLYDLFILVAVLALRIPKRSAIDRNSVLFFVHVLGAGIIVGTLSGFFRSGGELRPIQYGIQYFATVVYFDVVYRNLLVGRIEAGLVARYVILGSLLLATITLIHYFVMLVNRPLGIELYRDYLEFAGRTTSFFDGKYLHAVGHSGIVRTMGTWDVATTFGGMMVLSMAWLWMHRGSMMFKYIVFGVGTVALLASSSRHSWLIAVVVLFAILPGSFVRRIRAVMVYSSFLILLVLSQEYTGGDSLSLSEQVAERLNRTTERGLSDTSIVTRYVIGTRRFFTYTMNNPTVLLFGFGIGTEKSIIDAKGPRNFEELRLVHKDFGFVSNSWLLIWRNMGLVAFVGLVGLFISIFRLNPKMAVFPLLVTGLVIVADNYAVHVSRCFFLILAFLAVASANIVLSTKHDAANMSKRLGHVS